MTNHFFVTVDAETEVILEGVRQISKIRDRIELERGHEIPITWFVRFQRTFSDSVQNERRQFFESPLEHPFDGFGLLEPILDDLVNRGDEIGWHYHAYHYVMRDELPHEQKVQNIEADLVTCASTIRTGFPNLRIRAFRWGWFFMPDYRLHETLRELGFNIDASVVPGKAGKPVSKFNSRYPEPVTMRAECVNGTYYFPFVNTLLVHDYNVVPHQLGWTNQGEQSAAKRRENLANAIVKLSEQASTAGTVLSTYQAAVGTM